MSFSKENRLNTLKGISFVALFALASMYLAEFKWVAELRISPFDYCDCCGYCL